MYRLRFLLRITYLFICAVVSMCWTTLLFLVDLIDGDDDTGGSPADNIWHNRRTGEIDPVRQFDGIYDEEEIRL